MPIKPTEDLHTLMPIKPTDDLQTWCQSNQRFTDDNFNQTKLGEQVEALQQKHFKKIGIYKNPADSINHI
jgi:hypothetical protein